MTKKTRVYRRVVILEYPSCNRLLIILFFHYNNTPPALLNLSYVLFLGSYISGTRYWHTLEFQLCPASLANEPIHQFLDQISTLEGMIWYSNGLKRYRNHWKNQELFCGEVVSHKKISSSIIILPGYITIVTILERKWCSYVKFNYPKIFGASH